MCYMNTHTVNTQALRAQLRIVDHLYHFMTLHSYESMLYVSILSDVLRICEF